MNSVNKTLYIPLYGKSYVSKKGLFLDDKKAEEIWEAEGLCYLKEHIMIPEKYINELCGFERFIFGKLYAGSFSKKLYRLYEYKKD